MKSTYREKKRSEKEGRSRKVNTSSIISKITADKDKLVVYEDDKLILVNKVTR